jgi:hypothetical protein
MTDAHGLTALVAHWLEDAGSQAARNDGDGPVDLAHALSKHVGTHIDVRQGPPRCYRHARLVAGSFFAPQETATSSAEGLGLGLGAEGVALQEIRADAEKKANARCLEVEAALNEMLHADRQRSDEMDAQREAFRTREHDLRAAAVRPPPCSITAVLNALTSQPIHRLVDPRRVSAERVRLEPAEFSRSLCPDA